MISMLLTAAALVQAIEVQKGGVVTPLKPLLPPVNWVTDVDYPPDASHEGKAGRLHYVLTIDTMGKPDGCHVTLTSGYAELDQYTCAILLKRAKFHPALDAAGHAIRATYSGSFGWQLPYYPKAQEIPRIDLIVEVAKLPAEYTAPALTRVHFAATGKPDACRVEVSSGSAAVDKVACAQVMIQAPVPTQGISGGPTYDTRMVMVTFESASSK
ncbi:energy transducer TonB [Sphingomonas azotifigens]|uniref:energy transducer TonB n=1 Tax=Sphingomonas azotifigens TaxID=330920 RepID=UPI000A013830|nr:energy transducer TonB [Sphingomonas azotifigens]